MEAQSDVEIDGEASRGQSAQVGPSLPLRRPVALNLRHLLFFKATPTGFSTTK